MRLLTGPMPSFLQRSQPICRQLAVGVQEQQKLPMCSRCAFIELPTAPPHRHDDLQVTSNFHHAPQLTAVRF